MKNLISSQTDLKQTINTLSKLISNYSISVHDRPIYVSIMLLTMKAGLTPEDLKGSLEDNKKDSDIMFKTLQEYLNDKKNKETILNKIELFNDSEKNNPIEVNHLVKNHLQEQASINKQVFTFIYESIFLVKNDLNQHLDLIGEIYAHILKSSKGNGKEIGIVLTPPYIAKIMAEVLDVNKDDTIIDATVGTGTFLVNAKQEIKSKNENLTDNNKQQFLGVELNSEMFTLSNINMLINDFSDNTIHYGSAFNVLPEISKDYKITKALLNPPYSFNDKGLPFLELALSHMEIGGKAAIIIQDSAGNGQAIETASNILKSNQLITSVKMPADLFAPNAAVQTSIYILEHTGQEHDYDQKVRFIDFRNDGYKRTGRGIKEIDNPIERYQDIVQIIKNGKEAELKYPDLINIDNIVIEDLITDSGKDWNFEQHFNHSLEVTEEDFMDVVGEYLSWKISTLMKPVKK